MRKLIKVYTILNVFSALILFFPIFTSGQEVAPGKYKIVLLNKHNNSFSISNPEEFLSAKAIERRNKYGIEINSIDLPISPAYIDSIKSTGVTIVGQSKWLNTIIISNYNTSSLEQIYNFSFVKPYVETKSKIAKTEDIEKPSSIKSIKTNSLALIPFSDNELSGSTNYNYGYSTNQIQMIKVNELHNLGFDGKGITIAILDAGFYKVNSLSAFDSIRLNNQILGTKDFVSPGNNVYNEADHGMKVLSCIAANVPGSIIGTAPKASFWLLRSENAVSEYIVEEYLWAAAAEFADSVGVDIINSSLGYTTFDEASQNHDWSELDGKTAAVSIAATIAASKGIIVVNSAGNEGSNSWKYIGFPADADSILTVGAVNSGGSYAEFSSVGYTSNSRIKPDVVAQGAQTIVASSYGGTTTANGTSFSSPIMAGAVACLKQACPNATPMQIIATIKRSAHLYLSPNNQLGSGIPNMGNTLNIINDTNPLIQVNKSLNVYPNPFSDNLKMMYYSNDTKNLNIEIFDYLGRLFYQTDITPMNAGYNVIQLNDVQSLPNGMYIFKLSGNNTSVSAKITKITK